MRSSIKSSCFIVLTIFVVAIIAIPASDVSAQYVAITLDNLEGGSTSQGLIFCDQQIIFHIRATNPTANNYYGVGAVFEVLSTDGANWTPIVFDTTDIGWKNKFDGLVTWDEYSVSGSGSDTVGFFAFSIFGTGLPMGFDGVAWTIETYIECTESGKTICLDSVTNARGIYDWLWAGAVPTWDGPHCFTISKCCTGLRGDLNGDGLDGNILDLTFIVDFIFRGSLTPGTCLEERDANGDGQGPNVIDLTFLVDFIFRGGPPPEACP